MKIGTLAVMLRETTGFCFFLECLEQQCLVVVEDRVGHTGGWWSMLPRARGEQLAGTNTRLPPARARSGRLVACRPLRVGLDFEVLRIDCNAREVSMRSKELMSPRST
jgi:hypothetical protein